MTLECINPPDLPTPETYTQVVIAKGTQLPEATESTQADQIYRPYIGQMAYKQE